MRSPRKAALGARDANLHMEAEQPSMKRDSVEQSRQDSSRAAGVGSSEAVMSNER